MSAFVIICACGKYEDYSEKVMGVVLDKARVDEIEILT